MKKTLEPILQFTLILLIGSGIVLGTTWAVNRFEKPVSYSCKCVCPKLECVETQVSSYPQQHRSLMEELYFLRAVDGALKEAEFMPFMCGILESCKTIK